MTTRIRTLLVDDEQPARELLRGLLAREPRIEIVGEAADGVAAIELIRELAPDLVFLDVQMPKANGLEVVATIGVDAMPTVIFVTAYDQYALRAFDLSACDYLLKPFDEDRFGLALRRAIERHDGRTPPVSEALGALLRELRPSPPTPLVVKTEGRHLFLDPTEVDWIEAAGRHVRIHLGKTALVVKEPLTRLETRLDSRRFVRVHRSAIVNRSKIREMQPWFQGGFVLILRSGARVTTGPAYRDVVLALVSPA